VTGGDATGITTLTNSGAITVAAGNTLAAGVIDNAGTIALDTGARLQGTDNTLNNAGAITVGTDGTVTDAGAINNLAGGSIDFAGAGGTSALVSDIGVLSNLGAIGLSAGNVDAIGTLSNAGSATLDVAGGGTFAISGDLVAGDDAAVTVAAGSTLTAANLVTSGAASLTNAGTLTGPVSNGAGFANLAGGTAGAVTNTGTGSNAGTIAALVNSGGDFANAGTVATTLAVTGGAVTNSDTVTGVATVTGGGLTSSGTLSDDLVIAAGTFDNAGGTVAGNLVQSGGTVTSTGAVAGTVDVSGGSLANNAGGTVAGLTTISGAGTVTNAGTLADVANAASFTNAAGGTAGTVTNTATASNAGSIAALTTSDSFTNTGTIAGAAALTAGTLDNSGTIAGATSVTGGTLTTTGALAGGVINSATTLASGSIGGASQNLAGGSFTVNGDLAGSGGSLANAGTLTLAGGDFTGLGAFTNSATLTVGAGRTLSATALTNTGTANVAGVLANVGGLLDNQSLITLADGAVLGGSGAIVNRAAGQITAGAGSAISTSQTFANAGLIIVNGPTFAITASAFDGAGGRLDAASNGRLTDVITVTGDVTGTQNLSFNLDLSTPNPGGVPQVGDRMNVSGAITGTVNLDFHVAPGLPIAQPVGVVVLSASDLSGATLNSTGLPAPGGVVEVGLANTGTQALVVSQINPAIAGLAGNVSLVQSLIGTVVNRPTSPFVSGLVFEDPDKCNPGTWARGTGGTAEATALTDNGVSNLPATVDADYFGLQGGLDYGCFDAISGGWDVATGVIFGFNTGDVRQRVFALNPLNPTEFTDQVTSTTRGDFDQYYAGLYLAMARGPFAADLQLRREQTDFSFTNTAEPGFPGLPLTDADFTAKTTTLSGSTSYSFTLPNNLSLVPTAGFGLSWVDGDRLDFDDGSTLTTKDYTQGVAFVGTTLARTVIAESGTSAINQFVTATYYSDISENQKSVYQFGGVTSDLKSEGIGNFSELSLGLSYVKIFEEGQFGAAKQMNASVRGDYRFSDDVSSYGLTAQMRIQF
jgi:hypothetical protein